MEFNNPYEKKIKNLDTNKPTTNKPTTNNFLTNKQIMKFSEINFEKYFIYDVNLGEKNHKIIIKYPKDNSQELKELFMRLIDQYVNKNILNKYKSENFKKNDVFYPELLTLLTHDYFILLSDDNNVLNNLKDNFEEIFKTCYTDYKNYITNYLKYGLRIDNSINDINKRKFLIYFTNLIIDPNGILDNYKPLKKYTPLKKLKDLYYSTKYILPDKRNTKMTSGENNLLYSNNKINFSTWNKNENIIINDKILICYDYNLLMDYLLKTFNKFFLNDYYPKNIYMNNNFNRHTLEPIKSYQFKNLNNYVKILKNKNIFYQEIKKETQNETQNIFYQKWNNFLDFFNTFLKYYYDDFYLDKLTNKSIPFSNCLIKFNELSKSGANNANSSNNIFANIFIYCLLSKLNGKILEYYNLFEIEERTTKISILKNYFFNYMIFINRFFSDDFAIGIDELDPLINYFNHYYSKQIKFYGILNLSLSNYSKLSKLSKSPQSPQSPNDIEFFFNYVIYFSMSNTFEYLCKKIEIDLNNGLIKDTIIDFVDLQYKKIYQLKKINLYKINIAESLVDLYECLNQKINNYDLDKLILNTKKIINDNKLKSKLFLNPFVFNGHKQILIPDYYFDKIKSSGIKSFYIGMIDEIFKPKSYLESITLSKVLKQNDDIKTDDFKMDDIKTENKEMETKMEIDEDNLKKINFPILEYPYLYTDEKFIIAINNKYNQKVINCSITAINLLEERGFFDLINIVERQQINKFNQIVVQNIFSLLNFLQLDYDKDSTKFICNDDFELSTQLEDKILIEMENNDIFKFIENCYVREGIEYTVKISYEFFYPTNNNFETIGKYIYDLIDKNKNININININKSNDKSFLEIIYDKVIYENLDKNDKINNDQLRKIVDDFNLYIDDGLYRVLKMYKNNNTNYYQEDFYYKLLDDLIENILWTIEYDYIDKYIENKQNLKNVFGDEKYSAVVKKIEKFNKMNVTLKNTNIDININLNFDKIDEKLFCLIKSYLEECDEITRITDYYQSNQITTCIYELIGYYEKKIIEINKNTFCKDFTNNLLCLLIRQNTLYGDTINEIKINSEYYKLWVNEYINMGIIMFNFIQIYSGIIDKNDLQNALDFLGNFYLNQIDVLKKINTIHGLNSKIYNDINKYLFVKKCLNKYFQTDFFNQKIKIKYTVEDQQIITREIINLFVNYDYIKIKYKTNNKRDDVEIDVMDLINKNICPTNIDFTKIINNLEFKKKINKIEITPNNLEPNKKIGTVSDDFELRNNLIKKCLDDYYKNHFFINNIKTKYSPTDLAKITDQITNLFLNKDEIIFNHDPVNINVINLIKNKKCPSHIELTKIINNFEHSKLIKRIGKK